MPDFIQTVFLLVAFGVLAMLAVRPSGAGRR